MSLNKFWVFAKAHIKTPKGIDVVRFVMIEKIEFIHGCIFSFLLFKYPESHEFYLVYIIYVLDQSAINYTFIFDNQFFFQL